MSRNLKILRKTITAFAIIIILLGFALPLTPPTGNWYQQFMPNLNNMPISDIYFLDSLTGWAVTNNNMPQDSGYVLKTTNGGDNWSIKYKDKRDFSRIKFINSNTGFTCGGTGSGTPYFYKSTDGGNNWSVVSTFGCALWKDMYVSDENTIWLVDDDSFCGGVFYTSNGGTNWIQQSAPPTNKIYMYNSRIGYISKATGTLGIYKTTNGGQNWNVNLPNENFTDMHFVDSLTGWKCMTGSTIGDSCVKKTTNGGISWTKQILPSGGIITSPVIGKFSFLNRDTIWGVGSAAFYGSGQFRGIIYRSTNGGINWLFQVPDTTIHISTYSYVQFIDNRKGWAYSLQTGVHTTLGGDPIFYTGVKQISNQIPKEYKLFQNYPNPFNPRTVISYQLTINSNVELIVYDIMGKEVTVLVGQKQNPGTYQTDFSGNAYSSGVYFYSLFIGGVLAGVKKMILLK